MPTSTCCQPLLRGYRVDCHFGSHGDRKCPGEREEYRDVLPAAYLALAEWEHHSTFRSDVAVIHVPGPFQAEDYARALFAHMNPELPVGALKERRGRLA
ncbi:Scr1 family TA system antitoxin-like transcriptional regulator [Streptomyces prasinus]|uniref:Scr1 family TA system antitoxin-like transcriptional regulator n=1 Tax=Streptomyces prasinus TaxID=67345 RepID=UPI00363292FC